QIQRRAAAGGFEVVAEVGKQRHIVAQRDARFDAANALELSAANQTVLVVEQLGGLQTQTQRAVTDPGGVVDVGQQRIGGIEFVAQRVDVGARLATIAAPLQACAVTEPVPPLPE